MNGIIELKDVARNENAYVGYKSDLLVFLAKELKEYVEMIPSAEDFDIWHMEIVEHTSKVILDLANEQEDELYVVYDVLFETMAFYKANIEEV